MPRKTAKVNQKQKNIVSNEVKNQKAAGNTLPLEETDVHALSIVQQQKILNVFRTAFPIVQDTPGIRDLVQTVKGHLFARDFAAAFSERPNLEAYTLRWSAARALGYTHILTNPNRTFLFPSCKENGRAASETEHLSGEQHETAEQQSAPKSDNSTTLNVLCLGGGAGAEVVAFAAASQVLSLKRVLKVTAVDCADWLESVTKLTSTLTLSPTLSMYTSEATKSRPEHQPLLNDSSRLKVSFIRQDVLSWEPTDLVETFENVTICTIMFTLNELFSTSLSKTTSLLLQITSVMPHAGYLLVVDSPGSYSEIQLGKDEPASNDNSKPVIPTKRYPMKWLLDHTLLDVACIGNESVWEKVESEDSLWFRIGQKDRERLSYPLELENMRYQLHLYRKK